MEDVAYTRNTEKSTQTSVLKICKEDTLWENRNRCRDNVRVDSTKSIKEWGRGGGHCVTSQKVAGSIPDGVVGNFHWHNPSSCTMTLWSIQPLAEMSTRNISSWGVKVVGVKGWQPDHLHVPNVSKSGSLNLLEPSGPLIHFGYLWK